MRKVVLLLLFFAVAFSLEITQNYIYAYTDQKAQLCVLSYQPYKTIVITPGEYKESVKERLNSLKKYNIMIREVQQSNLPVIKDALIIVSSAGMPQALLDNPEIFDDNLVVYFGKDDFVLTSEGLKEGNWTNTLNKSFVRLEDVDTFLGKNEDYFLCGVYGVVSVVEGKGDLLARRENGKGVRFIVGDKIEDGVLSPFPVEISGKDEFYVWESTELSFVIPKSEGSAFFTLEKGGKKIYEKKLGFVTSPSAFVERLHINESGIYIAKVKDRLSLLGAITLIVKGVNISYVGKRDINYLFNITVNGQPVRAGFAYVSLNGGKERRLPIVDGLLVVPAKLKKGKNTFTIKYLKHKEDIVVENKRASVWDIYITYGLPGLFLVAAAFVYGKVAKKPTYKIITHEFEEELVGRRGVKKGEILDVFRWVEKKFGWKNVPLSIKEITWGIKERITEGIEVSQGNVEEILKKLVKEGVVESFQGYYQLKGWGDIKENVLKRKIRDLLVEKGISFEEKDGVFFVKKWKISPPKPSPGEWEILVFLDEKERRAFLSSLNEEENARIRLKMANGVVRLLTLDELRRLL